MEQIVCYARVSDIDLLIHGYKRYLNQYNRIEAYYRWNAVQPAAKEAVQLGLRTENREECY